MSDIVPVSTARQLRQFIDLPYSLYADDPHWVPPLLRDAHGSSLGFSSPPAGASAATGLPPGLRAGTAMLVMTRPRRSG